MKNFIIALLFIAVSPIISAQTADEIIDNYFENTGGKDAWGSLESVKYTGKVNAQGMEIPVTFYQLKDGRQLIKINFQGMEMTQMAFDGETLWTTNFQTMQPEKMDAEATENMKKQASKDFPSPFLNYADKGYSVELIGNETMEGTDTFKIKLTQDPVMVDGVEEPSISYHYFETENFVPIASESEIKMGPMKGQMSKNTMSDYQEVDGLFFPFDMTMSGQSIKLENIELNPEVDEASFKFPTKE